MILIDLMFPRPLDLTTERYLSGTINAYYINFEDLINKKISLRFEIFQNYSFCLMKSPILHTNSPSPTIMVQSYRILTRTIHNHYVKLLENENLLIFPKTYILISLFEIITQSPIYPIHLLPSSCSSTQDHQQRTLSW